MASLNKCAFIGNLTKDPETRYLAGGDAVTNASIAVNETWKGKDGSKQERVEFVNLVFYRRLAEIAGEYLKKGAPVYVEGKLATRKWEDKEGRDRYTTEIIVNELQMLGSKSDGQERAASEPRSAPTARHDKGGFEDFDDGSSIPF